jgi:uncharacterized membrane protein YwaF
MLIRAGDLHPEIKNIWRPALFLAVVVPPVYFFNHRFDTNFFFINEGAPDSPLSFLQTIFGNYYILSFVGLLFVVWFFMYLPFILRNAYRNRKSSDRGYLR